MRTTILVPTQAPTQAPPRYQPSHHPATNLFGRSHACHYGFFVYAQQFSEVHGLRGSGVRYDGHNLEMGEPIHHRRGGGLVLVVGVVLASNGTHVFGGHQELQRSRHHQLMAPRRGRCIQSFSLQRIIYDMKFYKWCDVINISISFMVEITILCNTYRHIRYIIPRL